MSSVRPRITEMFEDKIGDQTLQNVNWRSFVLLVCSVIGCFSHEVEVNFPELYLEQIGNSYETSNPLVAKNPSTCSVLALLLLD